MQFVGPLFGTLTLELFSIKIAVVSLGIVVEPQETIKHGSMGVGAVQILPGLSLKSPGISTIHRLSAAPTPSLGSSRQRTTALASFFNGV